MNITFKDKRTGAIIHNPQGEIIAVIKPVKTPKTGKDFRSKIEKAIREHECIDDAVLPDQNEFCPTEEEKKEFTVHTYRDGSEEGQYEDYKISPITIY